MSAEVILLPLAEATQLPDAYCETYFPERFARSKKFLRQEDAARCNGAGALLYGVLGLSEKKMQTAQFGKPYSTETELRFSISHSGDYILLAYDRTEIGADIEKINPSHLDVAKHVFLPEECEWISENPPSRFFTLWTLKESVMKQCGRGFRLPPTSFSVLPLVRGEGVCVLEKTLYASSMQIDTHCLSVCTEYPIATLSPKIIGLADLLPVTF